MRSVLLVVGALAACLGVEQRAHDGMVEVRGQILATDEVATEALDQLSDGAQVAAR